VSFASRVNVRTQSDSFETLRKKMKEILGNRVQDVIVSEDLISSQMPCFINLRNDVRNLEINPNHSAIVSLNNKVNEGSQDSLISHLVNTLFDESLCR
jgi:HSP90 family molecular chaperone